MRGAARGEFGFLRFYYLGGTLAFAALDWLLAAPIRAVFFGRPTHRLMYYLALLAVGLLCRFRPTWTPVLGMAESAVNLTLVLLSILLPIWGSLDAVAAGGEAYRPASTWVLLNALLSGAVLILAFQRTQRGLGRAG
ncbi:hypothetical protein [Gaopeijia maritima]|uniref:Uncharacterized protein n=1 Tax=Gaopeijia maritima TaxID=3119007 RepID=A0ABU9E917_9BACT